jgi:hypothetical protein
MTLRYDLKYEKEGFDDWNNFVHKLKKNLQGPMSAFGNFTSRKIRKMLLHGSRLFAKNSPPWAAAKGTRRPLYNTGHLSQSVSSKVVPGSGDTLISVEVGFLSNSVHPDGSGKTVKEIANILAAGASWTPAPIRDKGSPRRAFWAKVGDKYNWKEKGSVRHAVYFMPKRDFFGKILGDPVVNDLFAKKIDQATKRTLKGM